MLCGHEVPLQHLVLLFFCNALKVTWQVTIGRHDLSNISMLKLAKTCQPIFLKKENNRFSTF